MREHCDVPTMTTASRVDGRVGYVLAVVGAAVGFALGTPQTAVLAAIVAFFVGKSINSTLRVFSR
jgi:hypothetical protein